MSTQDRYSRHRRIPEVGDQGQDRIGSARVLVIGAGGLGSPALMYLAAAGVGTIGIVDYDAVDITNLQRQVIFPESAVGVSKAEMARKRISELNSGIDIKVFNSMLTSENALEVISDFDLVIDATDNFATRYLINDACVLLGLPYVWGSILRFDGQISVFGEVGGPCYRCIFPQPPEPGTVPSCADAGVLGSMCGVIGSMQATQALNIILGLGAPLAGNVGVFNALDMSFQKVPIQRNPNCVVCGDSPTITELIDYNLWCSSSDNSIARTELIRLLDERTSGLTSFTLVDIREQVEVDAGMIPGAVHLALSELAASSDPLGLMQQYCDSEDVILYCKSGGRSASLILALDGLGLSNVRHYPGGYDDWAAHR